MECENCNKQHDGSYASGRFCSKQCSKAFCTKGKRAEISRKVSEKLKGRQGHSKEKMLVIAKKVSQSRIERFQNASFEELGIGSKKVRILEEQNGCCISCNLSEWLGEPIKFELDHIDGDKANNNRDNLRVMCPNCHSMTPTWRKKKIYL